MALADVVWGTWRYGDIGLSSKNGMRLGMAIYWGSPNSGSASVSATVEIWTENEFTHSGDGQRLNYSANLGSDTTYTNNSGGSPVLRATKTYTYNYSTWGSSPGNVTFTAELTEHYWDDGTNPTVSRTVAIPARPGGPPTVTSASASAGIRSATISWSGSGDPGIYQYNVYRNNDGNQLIYAGGGTSVTDTALGNSQTVFYIVYAYNAAGNGYAFTNTVTTAALPTGVTSLTANTSTFGQITLSWAASDGGVYGVDYTIARDGLTLASTGGATSWTDTNVLPNTSYTYTVVPYNGVGSGTGATITVTSLGGVAKIWNGTTWVVVLPKVWNGTAWVDAQARMWNGTSWAHGI